MGKYLKEYWFGLLLFALIGFTALFLLVVVSAPHNDRKMRGFMPCTYAMAAELEAASQQRQFSDVFFTIFKSYVCYAGVMADGGRLWLEGKQKTPWANYLFESETDPLAVPSEISEPFSEELLKANLLDEDDKDNRNVFGIDDKENDDDGK